MYLKTNLPNSGFVSKIWQLWWMNQKKRKFPVHNFTATENTLKTTDTTRCIALPLLLKYLSLLSGAHTIS